MMVWCQIWLLVFAGVLFKHMISPASTVVPPQVAGWMRQQFSINVQGVIGAQVLQELLAPAGLQHAQVGCVVYGGVPCCALQIVFSLT